MQELKLQLLMVILSAMVIFMFWAVADSVASNATFDYRPMLPPATGLAQGNDTALVDVTSGVINSVPGSVVVTVTATIPATPTFGAIWLNVSYDPTVATASGCTADPQNQLTFELCNTAPADQVAIFATSLFGISGPAQITLAAITFDNVAVISATTNLTVSVLLFNEPFFGPPIPYTTSDGVIYILEEPTAIDLISFSAVQGGNGVTVLWETGTEINNAGFNLYRAIDPEGPYTQINPVLIPARGDAASGAGYSYLDTAATDPDTTYYYKLEDIDFNGTSTFHGPIDTGSDLTDGADSVIYLPLLFKEAGAGE